MTAVFIAVLLMSITGALLVLCLSLLRPATTRCFNAAWHYRVHMLAMLFLLVPIGAAGGKLLARIPNKAEQTLVNVPVVLNELFTPPQNNALPQPQGVLPPPNASPTVPEAVPAPGSALALNVILSYLPSVWLVGVSAFMIVHGVRLVRFRRKLARTSLETEDETQLSILQNAMSDMGIKGKLRLFSNDMVKTPMLIGLFKTRLILPEVDMTERELAIIFKHELTHFKRRDLWAKSLALLANALHWFNPAAYRLTKDIDAFCELSCDERVVADMSAEERRFYGETILNVLSRAVSQYSGVYATLAESKKGIKRRLSHIMRVKANTKRIALMSLIVAALLCLAGCAVASLMNIDGVNAAPDDQRGEEITAPDDRQGEEIEQSPPPTQADTVYLDAFKAVLLGDAEFFSTDADKNLDMSRLAQALTSDDSLTATAINFAVVDLDHDGTPEIILGLKLAFS